MDFKSSFQNDGIGFNQMTRKITRFSFTAVSLVAVLALLSACNKDDKKAELPYIERPVEELYEEGHRYMENESYETAALFFDEVERQHPYSEWARRAQLMAAYAYYKTHDYDGSILAAQRFLQLHPGNTDAPYAFYLIALNYYEQIVDVGRDQSNTEAALSALNDIIRRYPDTEYASDARLKFDLTMDHLSGKEMTIGRFYQKKGDFLGAIHRFRNVVIDFQTTSHVAEALHRLTECYMAMGVRAEAQASAAVLGHNFPGSNWYEDSYALLKDQDLTPVGDPDGWIARIF